MAKLTIRRGPDTGKVYLLNKDVVTIGRGTKNDIVINDNDVSRSHCQLLRHAGGYEIEDLNSTNGTFINGQRVMARRILKGGQLIELGDMITLEYEKEIIAPGLAPPKITPINMSKDFALAVEIGPTPRRIYSLNEETITIGRDLSNKIVIQDPEVSRWHLQLLRTPDGNYTAKDLGSTNGTILNGSPVVGPKPLSVFDILELGTAVRLFYIHDTEEARQWVMDEMEGEVQHSVQASKTDTQEQALNFAQRRKTSKLGTGLRRGGLVNHIIIAYAREDWESMVAPLTLALQDAGMKVWVDQYLVQGGDDWQTAIEQALQECGIMVLVVSPDALESSSCPAGLPLFYQPREAGPAPAL